MVKESPFYLFKNDRITECKDVLMKIAIFNKKSLPYNF